MKKVIRTLAIFLCLLFTPLASKGQQVNTMYFLDNVPTRHYLNPAFQPLSNFYFGLPVLGYTQFDLGINNFALNDLKPNFNTTPYSLLNTAADKSNFINKLLPTTYIGTHLNVNLLDFGFRTHNSYWSFGITEKFDFSLGLPLDVFKLGVYSDNIIGNDFNFKNLNLNSSLITELALGYSNKINDVFSVGGKLKFLYGTANISMQNNAFSINTTDPWALDIRGSVNVASPVVFNGQDLFNLDTNKPELPQNISGYFTSNGLGAAFDLGATYKPINNLTISAAVTDLGMMRWNRNALTMNYTANYSISGMNSIDIMSINNSTNFDSINVTGSYTDSVMYNPYTTYTSPKLNIGIEYSFLEDKLSLGLLSRTIFQNKTAFEELTASINGKPIDWFNMSLSYSVLNGRFSNIGAGMGVRIGFINCFFAADYIPVSFTSISLNDLNSNLPASSIPIPTKTQGINLALGVNLVFGNRKDKDKDGVVDRKDKCPETPFGVIVDKKGCPVDTDGDGVPDYLDKCPNTPPAAYSSIDQNGCPLDNDNDSVPDYLDQCPDTPEEAIGFVDEKGCEKDSDKDGIFDYKDKCPETPEGVKVDSVGCPLDSDHDGVADYLDLCPDTPVEARNMVDKNGCPLDTDGDGVKDYLDLCPNTPIEALRYVDSNGCTLDTDDDGIPDYLDKCPDTPLDARGKVDEHGCPRDTDGDGILDYLDNCPTIPGVASNNGCPEIKKEVRKLFQQALLGIQFESGKDLIRTKSFPILNQIAKVLLENPTYLIEIRGHTDNVGKPDMNQDLSERRAFAVKNYLIGKGVPEKRMTSNGFGDTKPVASNKTAAGRAQNRRVEFVITFEEVTFE